MRFDPSEPFFLAAASRAAPTTRPRRRPAVDRTMPQSPLNYRPFPSWVRLEPKPLEEGPAAFFAAGASLALLDGILRQNPPFAGALRNRLALKAAATSARLLRLRQDEAALRDAEHLAASEDPGLAGRLHRLWRSLAGQHARLDAERFGEALRLLDLPKPGDVASLVGELRDLTAGAGDPVTLAAQAATRAYRFSPGPEGEIFAAWTADLLLAMRLGWEWPTPLLMTKILDLSLRSGRTGVRPRPNDSGWPQLAAAAYALAAGDAHALAVELSRRAEKHLAVAPKLRAKRASRVVELLLTEDCVAASRAASFFGLSDRASRRLFDRLVELEAVREVSGRTAFRLNGL